MATFVTAAQILAAQGIIIPSQGILLTDRFEFLGDPQQVSKDAKSGLFVGQGQHATVLVTAGNASSIQFQLGTTGFELFAWQGNFDGSLTQYFSFSAASLPPSISFDHMINSVNEGSVVTYTLTRSFVQLGDTGSSVHIHISDAPITTALPGVNFIEGFTAFKGTTITSVGANDWLLEFAPGAKTAGFSMKTLDDKNIPSVNPILELYLDPNGIVNASIGTGTIDTTIKDIDLLAAIKTQSVTAVQGKSFEASKLVSLNPATGSQIHHFEFKDTTATGTSGYFELLGAMQNPNVPIAMSDTDLANLTFHAGIGSDTVQVRASADGGNWSPWLSVTVKSTTNFAPTMHVMNAAMTGSAILPLATLVSATDANTTDTVTGYQFQDKTIGGFHGYIGAGAGVATADIVDVATVDLDATPFVAESPGLADLWVRATDGALFGKWVEMKITVVASNDITGDKSATGLFGGAEDNTLFGLAGADLLYGGDGNDTADYSASPAAVTVNLSTGVGSGGDAAGDRLVGIENVTGSKFNDLLIGNAEANYLLGGAGNDTIEGGGGGDVLDGGPGVNTLSFAHSKDDVFFDLSVFDDDFINFQNVIGGAGNDFFRGADNANRIDGGSGDDQVQDLGGNDTLIGGPGNDMLFYFDAPFGVTVSLALTTPQKIGGAGIDTVSGFENIFGSEYDDVLTGDKNANWIMGDAGNDVIDGGAGNDDLEGDGPGGDTVSYASATAGVIVDLAIQDGVTGQDTKGAGVDILEGFENLTGSKFNDTLTGDDNDNVISGGLGNDTLNGGGGGDTASYANATAAVTVSLLVQGVKQATGGGGIDILNGIANLTGGAGGDRLTGDDNDNVIQGGAGNDTIEGGAGTDTLDGGSGVNTLSYAHDLGGVAIYLPSAVAPWGSTITNFQNLTGGFEGDALTGDDKANRIDGGAGDDTIEGGGGNDVLIGGGGNDTVSYAGSSDNVSVSLALTAAQKTGGAGTDTLSGFENITGGSGNDVLTGSKGANLIDGGPGDDVLTGGGGNDVLTGGDGADQFLILGPPTDKSFVAIGDFVTGTDHLALKKSGFGIPAAATSLETAPGGPVYFVEGVAPTEKHGQFIFDAITDPDHHRLYADADGNGPKGMVLLADFGTADFAVTDFLLK